MIATCPLCHASDPIGIFRANGLPLVCNHLAEDEKSARDAVTGDLDLVVCRACTLIWNRSFEPAAIAYAPGYENPLHHALDFRAYADDLAAELVVRHGLAGRHVVEVGCGDGHMLDLMVKHGAATATGFDPSMAGRATPFTERAGVEIVPEYFSAAGLDRPCDAVLLRHVLEHLEAPVPFLQDIRRAMGERTGSIYVEVPNVPWILESISIWDVIYEHVTYWSSDALETLLRRTGFRPLRLGPAYGGQFMQAEGMAGRIQAESLPETRSAFLKSSLEFAGGAEAKLEGWRRRLGESSGTAVLWGAGSKGITFANTIDEAAGRLVALVDLNPRKHGRWVPGVALPVVPPLALQEIRPDLVLIANALYQDEIRGAVRDLGLDPEFEVIVG